ncbi:unnamed protein product [Linum trigynum]|uniref:Uncharacterized protein n=1 Tax=Linum trigynum TaxID=586398 RepID=A0AAV2GUW5_9ROSI
MLNCDSLHRLDISSLELNKWLKLEVVMSIQNHDLSILDSELTSQPSQRLALDADGAEYLQCLLCTDAMKGRRERPDALARMLVPSSLVRRRVFMSPLCSCAHSRKQEHQHLMQLV